MTLRGSNSIACYRELFRESIDSANFIIVLFQETAIATPNFGKHHPDQSVAINIGARHSIIKKITTV
jgi:hypothetical protein